MITSKNAPLRRAARLAVLAGSAGLVGSVSFLALPAYAEEPYGWSNPAPVSGMDMLLVVVIVPLAVAAVITLLVILPSLVRRQKEEASHTPDQWFGGPRSHELEAPGSADARALESDKPSEIGGASGSW